MRGPSSERERAVSGDLDRRERRLKRYDAGRAAPSRRRERRGLAPVSPALALLPLRLFLGVTFMYAGIQKLSDPGFLHPGAPSYIGTLLHDYAMGTPGGFVLRLLALPHPALAGVGVAVVEIAVGLLVTIGLVTRGAALVGLCLNLLLFLTASWKTSPYFLGSDIVFVFGWLPLALAGTAGQPALEHVIERRVHTASAPRRQRAQSGRSVRGRPAPCGDPAITRRTLVGQALGAAALVAGAMAGIASLAKGSYTGRAIATLGSQSGSGAIAQAPSTPTSRHTAGARSRRSRGSRGAGDARGTASATGPRDGVRLGSAAQLPRGQAALYRDPTDGQPDIIIREPDGTLVAFSAICTHAGCEVQYQSGAIVCPCHGSVFNPRTGAVEQGPAVTPLPSRRVVQSAGEIYALPT